MKETIKANAPGEKPTPPTPASKIAAVLAGKYGPKGKQQALFAKNVLKG